MQPCIKYTSFENKILYFDNPIILEKIDGANFGIGFVNDELRVQSRRQILDRDSKFMNHHLILEELIVSVKKIHHILKQDFLVYGEIFGKHVVNRMEYEDIETPFTNKTVFFRAFDILKVSENAFLKYSDAIDIFKQAEMPYQPILDIHYRILDELCVKVEYYKSLYSQKPVEGFVVKKNEEEKKYCRNIFKVKRSAFNENNGLLNVYWVKNYINKNRLISAYTKYGDNRKKVYQEMITDALKDIMEIFKSEVPAAVEMYCKYRPKTIHKIISPNDKFQIESYVNESSYNLALYQVGDNLEDIKEKMIRDALPKIEMVYRKKLETLVQDYINKNYKNILDTYVKYQ